MAVTPSAQYSITLRVEMDSTQADLLGQLTTAIGAVGGDIGAIDLVGTGYGSLIRELVVNASDQDHADAIVAAAERAGRGARCSPRSTAPSGCTRAGRSR